jgi:hypothetical protein
LTGLEPFGRGWILKREKGKVLFAPFLGFTGPGNARPATTFRIWDEWVENPDFQKSVGDYPDFLRAARDFRGWFGFGRGIQGEIAPFRFWAELLDMVNSFGTAPVVML